MPDARFRLPFPHLMVQYGLPMYGYEAASFKNEYKTARFEWDVKEFEVLNHCKYIDKVIVLHIEIH